MKFNMNDTATVTLTAYGAEVWNARHDGLGIPKQYLPPLRAAGETLTAQLWDIMHVFGPGIHRGMREVPFLQNEIEISNGESIGYYKAKMEHAQRQLAESEHTLVNARACLHARNLALAGAQSRLAAVTAERDEWRASYNGQNQVYLDIAANLGAKLPEELVNDVARRRMQELATVTAERDTLQRQLALADALINKQRGLA